MLEATYRALSPGRRLLLLFVLAVLSARSSFAAETAPFKAVTPTPAGARLSAGTFEVFNPANIPEPVDVPEPSFRAQFFYSGRDWQVYVEPPTHSHRPEDVTRHQRIFLSHRAVPAGLVISFERVESAADADPVTLAKILRFNREASSNFRVLSESPRRFAGVDGIQSEYVKLRKKKLIRVRHWITHYNGVVCQIELLVPYEHPELLDLGGNHAFPLRLEFPDRSRNRPLLKDADIPRTFASAYGYRIDLGDGEWIPACNDPYISLAEYVAYTRNQGGIAVVPLSTLGLEVDSVALLDAVGSLGDLPNQERLDLRHISEGKLRGITFDTYLGNEDGMIHVRAKAICSTNHAYLALAWVNTNSPLGPEALDQWLKKISFDQNAAAWPTNTQGLVGLREKDRQALGLLDIGEFYSAKRDFARSAAVFRTAMDCRFLPRILTAYARAEHRRGHPEEIVSYLKSRGPFALREGWVLVELAYAESRCGDFGKAASHYTQCIASGGLGIEDFSPDCFEDFIRCLIKADRPNWASDRLKQRIAVDPSPLWPKMLAELSNSQQSAPATSPPVIPTVPGTNSPAPAGTPRVTAAAAPPTGPPHLKTIIWNPGKPSAQLDQNFAFEGDRVRGYKVVKILQDSVNLLTPDGGSLTLRSTQ